MPIRAGVIGAGIMGADRIRNLSTGIGGAVVAFVADLDADRAAAAAPCSARIATDPSELINSNEVDEHRGPVQHAGGFEVRFPDGTRLRHDEPAGGHFEGLQYEASAVARAIAAGSSQASQRTLASSIRTLEVADEIRWRLGVLFPGEAGTAAAP